MLKRSFLESEDTVMLAKALLGCILISKTENQLTKAMILETEAYKAPEDKASHAYNNRLTKRTKTMFGHAGHAYIYLCYGIHHMLNVVTGPQGKAHAVLIRAVEPLEGIDTIIKRRNISGGPQLTNGPGKLTSALGITTVLNNMDLLDTKSMVRLQRCRKFEDSEIICSPRVGVAYAKECAHWPWRFRVKESVWTSLPHEVSYTNS